jgi:heat shock protein HtpX
MLIQMAISRTREFGADAAAARAQGTPHALANALAKLENYSHRIPMQASPSMSHMFIMKPHSLMRLFSTHPATEERIARLRAIQL